MKYFLGGLLIFISVTFFFACAEKKEDLSSFNFYDSQHLNSLEIKEVEDVNLRYPFRVRQNSSGIYLMDLHGSDYFCHHLEYPSMRLIRSFVCKGNGSEEFLDAENIRLTSDGNICVLDADKRLLTVLDQECCEIKKIVLPEELIRPLDFALFSDSLFIVPDYTGTHRFDIISSQGEIIKKQGEIPLKKRDKDIADIAYAQAWRSFLDYNPSNGILAIATQLGDVIQIYDLSADSLVNTIYGKDGIPRFKYKNGNSVPDGIMGYSDIHVGKESIYALFWGHVFDDIKRNLVEIEGGNILRIFDLKGNPVKQYILDHYITGFHIDEETKKMIGLDVNNDQQIVEYFLN